MVISKNIFSYVRRIRAYNGKVKGFNEKLKQYFELEFSYFKANYLFEKNFKSNMENVDDYKNFQKKLKEKQLELENVKKSNQYANLTKKQNKINQSIKFEKTQLGKKNILENKKNQIKRRLEKMLIFKENFEKNNPLLKKIDEIEKDIKKFSFYLKENTFFADMDVVEDMQTKIENLHFQKQQLFNVIKAENVPQERATLSEIIKKIESSQTKNSNFAGVILDKRFQLEKIEFKTYFDDLEHKILHVVEMPEINSAKDYLENLNQKFSNLGFFKT